MSDLERTRCFPNSGQPKPKIHRMRVSDDGRTHLQYNGHPCWGKTTVRRVGDKIYLTTAVTTVDSEAQRRVSNG